MGGKRTRRLPAPWRAVQIPGGYVIEDSSGQKLAYVYAKSEIEGGTVSGYLTWDEARRVAGAIAKLPEMIRGTTEAPMKTGQAE